MQKKKHKQKKHLSLQIMTETLELHEIIDEIELCSCNQYLTEQNVSKSQKDIIGRTLFPTSV